MELRILGPLEGVEDGNPVALGNLKERLVLGVLLLHPNEFVSRERLIDDLWGEAPPPTARKAVNVYVSKLRKALGDGGAERIATASGGYRLHVEPDELDATRMQRLLATARECVAKGALESAGEHFREALALWRGPTLAGLQLESRGREEVAQLDELRISALMDRIDCDLALGRHEDVLGELGVLVREHPLRERLRAQQMLALYRADRQADALEAYAEARRTLVDDLGIEPSEALQRLQQAILRHDPALETPAGTVAGTEPAASADLPASDRDNAVSLLRAGGRKPAFARRSLALAALAGAAAVATLAVLSTRDSRLETVRSSIPVKPNSIARIDPATGAVVSDSAAGLEPAALAFSGHTVWIVSRGDRTVLRADMRTPRMQDVLGTSSRPYAIAAAPDGAVWVSNRKPVVTWILHPASGSGTSAVPPKTKNIRVPLPRAGAEAYGGGYLWVIPGPLTGPGGNGGVSLIDVRTHRVAPTVSLGRETTAIAYGFGFAWIGTYDHRQSAWLSVVRADSKPESFLLEKHDGWGPLAIAAGEGHVWVLTSAGTLIKIDPVTQRIITRIRLSAKQPLLLAAGAGYVWAASPTEHSVLQIDPRTNKLVHTIRLGNYASVPCGIVAGDRGVWVAMGDAYCDPANR